MTSHCQANLSGEIAVCYYRQRLNWEEDGRVVGAYIELPRGERPCPRSYIVGCSRQFRVQGPSQRRFGQIIGVGGNRRCGRQNSQSAGEERAASAALEGGVFRRLDHPDASIHWPLALALAPGGNSIFLSDNVCMHKQQSPIASAANLQRQEAHLCIQFGGKVKKVPRRPGPIKRVKRNGRSR